MRIVIAEDDPLLREGIGARAGGRGRSRSSPPSATASSCSRRWTEHEPDVAVVDVRMPPTHTDEGVRAAVEARRRQPGLPVLVLSAYVEQAFATELLAQGSAGSATC